MPDIPDVVIVGGGLLGTALAYELARHTYRVTLLEEKRLASGATGGGFAWINATAKTDDEDYHRLNAEGVGCYTALAETYGAEQIGLRSGGALFWAGAADATGRENLRRKAARLQGLGYPASMVTAEEMRALEPRACFHRPEGEGAEGLFTPADKWVDTMRLTRFFAERVRERQGEIREYVGAMEFTRSRNQAILTVETTQGRLPTRLLILAAGVQTPTLVTQVTENPADSAYVPLRREPGLLVETPPGSAVGQAQRILYPPDAGGLHLRPTPGGGLLLGADDTDAAFSGANYGDYLPDAPASLLRRAALALPELPVAALEENLSARVCVRPVPADGLPIVGALPGAPGVYVAVTHSGVTLGPLLAQLLAEEIITGRMPSLLERYRPDRFRKDRHP